MAWFALLVAAVAAERVVELVVARRHLRWCRARGGVEWGRGHYPVMVALHAGLLVCAPLEAWLLQRPFVPAPGWTALALVVAAQVVRVWCVRALGPRWTTRVVVVPGLPLVARGPYRFLRHPNYLAVVVEVAALPLVHSAWVTAAVFSAANLALLRVRVRTEEAAPSSVSGRGTPSEPVPPSGADRR